MADNKLEVLLQSFGFDTAASEVKKFIQLLLNLNTVDVNTLKRKIEEFPEVLKSVGLSAKQAEVQVQQLFQGKKAFRTGGGDLKSQVTKIRVEIEQRQLDQEIQDKATAAKPAILQSKIAVAPLTDNLALKQPLAKEIGSIKDETARVKAAQEYVKLLDEEYQKLLKTKKTIEEKTALTENYVKLLQRASSQTGAEKVSSGYNRVAKEELSVLNSTVAKKTDLTKANLAQAKTEQEVADATEKNRKEQDKLSNSIGVAIGKLLKYRISFFAMHGALNAVRSSIKNFIDTQYELADLEKVINRQTDSISKYREEAFKLSQEFGTSISEIVDSFKIWAQAGLAQNEVLEATRATLIGVNAMGMSALEVTEALTAAIFTYKVETEDLTRTVSKWLAVQREFPVSAGDLANSLKAVGAAAQVVGVDLDDLAGYVSAINSATRKSGAAVGQSLKTMFARLPRAETIKVFERLNISVLKNADEIKDLDNVLDSLSEKWDTLGSVQKANLSITLGGIRRYSDFIALMDNYDIKLAAVAIAQKANNEAQDASQLSLNTLKKEIEKATAILQEFGVAFGQTLATPIGNVVATFQSFTKILKPFKGAIAGVASTVTLITGSLITASVIVYSFNFAIKYLTKQFHTLSGAIFANKATQAGFEAQTLRSAAATTLFGRAVAGAGALIKSTSFWIFGLTTVLSLVIGYFTIFGKKQQEASSFVEDLNKDLGEQIRTNKDHIKGLETEIKLYERLKTSIPKRVQKIIDLREINSPDAVKELESLHTIFKALPDSEEKVQDGIRTVSSSMRENKIATAELTDALDGYITKQSDVLKALKANNVELIKTYEITATSRRAQIATAMRDFDNFKDDISKLNFSDLGFGKGLTKYNFNLFKTIANVFKEGIDILPKGGILVLPGVDAYSESIEDTIAESIKKNGMEGAKKQFGEELSNLSEIIKLRFGEFKRVGEGYGPDVFGNIVTKEEEATKNLELIGSRWEVVTKEMEREGIDVATHQEEFISRLASSAGEYFTTLDKLASASAISTIGKSKLEEELQAIDRQLGAIRDYGEEAKGGLRIGVKPSKDVVDLSEDLDKLIIKYEDVAESYQTAFNKLQFGEAIDFSQFRDKSTLDFIDEIGNKMDIARQSLKFYIQKQKDLEEVQRRLGVTGADAVRKLQESVGDIDFDDLLVGMSSYIKDIVLGNENAMGSLSDEIEKVQQSAEELENFLSKSGKINEKYETVLKALREIIVSDQERYIINLRIQSSLDPQIEKYEALSKAFGKFRQHREEAFGFDKKAIDSQYQMEVSSANLLRGQEKINAELKAEENRFNAIKKLMADQMNYRLDIILSDAVENAGVLENALANAFKNIPDTIGEFADKRAELTKDLKDAERELQQARGEGDANSIAQAQYRVDLVKYEMDQYKAGWSEIREIVVDIFSGIGTKYQEKLSEKVAQSLADISVGDITLGEKLGDAIDVSTAKFTGDWRSAATKVINEHAMLLRGVFEEHANRLQIIQGIKPVTGTPEEKLAQSNAQYNQDTLNAARREWNETRDTIGESGDKTVREISRLGVTLLSLGNLIASSVAGSIASSIVGKRGSGTTAGSQFGSAIGGTLKTGENNKLFGANLGAALGSVVPVLGTLAGGIFGGLVGSLFDREDKEPEQPLERAVADNTNAVLQNTLALKELDKAFFNAPTNFNVPVSSGGFGNVTVNINGASNPTITANRVREVLEEIITNDSRLAGSRGYANI